MATCQQFNNYAPTCIRMIRPTGGTPVKKIIQCPCGSVIEGNSDEEVVKNAQEHAKSTHGMDLSKEQALAMARPA
jgi:predicted small metal-binding protein